MQRHIYSRGGAYHIKNLRAAQRAAPIGEPRRARMAKCHVPARLQARIDTPIKAHTAFVVALTVARSAAAIATGAP